MTDSRNHAPTPDPDLEARMEQRRARDVKRAIQRFRDAAANLCETWTVNECAAVTEATREKYPFDESFDEVFVGIADWAHVSVKKLHAIEQDGA